MLDDPKAIFPIAQGTPPLYVERVSDAPPATARRLMSTPHCAHHSRRQSDGPVRGNPTSTEYTLLQNLPQATRRSFVRRCVAQHNFGWRSKTLGWNKRCSLTTFAKLHPLHLHPVESTIQFQRCNGDPWVLFVHQRSQPSREGLPRNLEKKGGWEIPNPGTHRCRPCCNRVVAGGTMNKSRTKTRLEDLSAHN